MERAASVFLHADIDTSKTANLLNWIKDPVVTRYLNEKSDIAEKLNHILNTVHPSLLSCQLNKSGRFYFVCKQNNEAIGFARLANTEIQNEYELVIVIGRKDIWGRGYGTKAVRECLNTAFFDWRADRVTAYVHFNNIGCARALQKAGMKHVSSSKNCDFYDIALNEFLSSLSREDVSVNS